MPFQFIHYILQPVVFLFCCSNFTCDVEVSVAGGLAHFVGDDALVDAAVGVAHGADDQAVDVTDCRARQRHEAHYRGDYSL